MEEGISFILVICRIGDGSGGCEEGVDTGRLFWERDDVSYGVCVAEDCHESIEAQGDSAVGRGSAIECMDEVCKSPLFGSIQPEHSLKDSLL